MTVAQFGKVKKFCFSYAIEFILFWIEEKLSVKNLDLLWNKLFYQFASLGASIWNPAMGTKKKPKKTESEFDLDAFSAELEEMAAVDRPPPPPKESELLKAVREKYDLLKVAIVTRGHPYQKICDSLIKAGLVQGAYPRALKEALIKVAAERGEVWEDGRKKPKSIGTQAEESGAENAAIQGNGRPQTDSVKESKFVEVPSGL